MPVAAVIRENIIARLDMLREDGGDHLLPKTRVKRSTQMALSREPQEGFFD
jgi:hypothetical protein